MSGSGRSLDPAISVANARIQADRVAAERGLPLDALDQVLGSAGPPTGAWHP